MARCASSNSPVVVIVISVPRQFFCPWARRGFLRAEPRDPQLGKELWTWLEEQVAALE